MLPLPVMHLKRIYVFGMGQIAERPDIRLQDSCHQPTNLVNISSRRA